MMHIPRCPSQGVFLTGSGLNHFFIMKKQSILIVVALGLVTATAFAQSPPPAKPPAAKPTTAKPDFPAYTTVLKGYEQVISSMDKKSSLLSIYVRKKDQQMLGALPAGFESKRFFIATTVASGEMYAGLQAGEKYVYFKRLDKRLLIIEPNLNVRSTGDPESKASVKRLFTDRVIVDVPIVTLLPKNRPVIDMDALLVGQASKFFGSRGGGFNAKLAQVRTAKAFPGNVELAFTAPSSNGVLKTLHYSISLIVPSKTYKPRVADQRVGYFTTSYSDLGKYTNEQKKIRYINRWHLEKADPKLKVSPVKNPIIFYIEHTTPVRYRRWVREGILMWNKAYDKVGLANAIEVYYQDATTSAHMEKDPEDARYNFVRWLNNDVGTAIGPSRVNPLTGQILDADIILTDGWIRHYWMQFNEILPSIAMEGFAPETLAWLKEHPEWDPRVRLAHPSMRASIKADLAAHGAEAYGGHPLAKVDGELIGDNEFDGLYGRISQVNGLCRAAEGMSLDLAAMRFSLELAAELAKEEGEKDDKGGDKPKPKPKKTEVTLDGVPEWFIGPLIAELVAHEVGHTLGLRHNFKASSIHSLEKINSDEIKGKETLAGSVMDYLPINMHKGVGEKQGDHTMTGIGPYDHWAIEYGYSIVKKPEELQKILSRVSDPKLQFATDEDTIGPDPFARRYDFASNPLQYAHNQMNIVKHHRGQLLDHFVKKGQSWAKARYGYQLTLSLQARSLSMMGNWIGGSFVNRDKKGDPGDRYPITPVPAKRQREALEFMLENAFNDEAFGLNNELLRRMGGDRWIDNLSSSMKDTTWPVHEKVMGIQASTLTMILNPTSLGRVYDNEFLVEADKDAITLPEILGKLDDAIWTELKDPAKGEHTARKPLISSLRRNLQREHLERLVSLSMPGSWRGASSRPLANLASQQLRSLAKRIDAAQKVEGVTLDPYTAAHLSEAGELIKKTLDAGIIYGSTKL